MQHLKLFLCLVLLLQQQCWTAFAATQTNEAHSAQDDTKHVSIEEQAAGKTLLAILGKSRQSRCVRCFEDRYYEDRSRYPTTGYGRTPDDRYAANNWYYPSNNEDRYNSYDRYDRYSPRGSERYEGRDSDRGYDRFDRYEDRRGVYDRGDTRGYDRLGYGAQDRDRYYDRSSARPLDYSLDRDYYDRSNYRYDNRNYRPWDETYRGQSGFDNNGRGHYYANNQEDRRSKPEDDRRYLPEDDRRYLPEDDRRYLPEDDRRYLPENERKSGPCGPRVINCPYDMPKGSRGDSMGQVSSGAIQSNSASMNAKGSSVVSKDSDKKEQNNDDMRRNENQERDRQHSSAYDNRAQQRPLKRNYLYGREGYNLLNEDDNEIRNNLEPNSK